jgi:hypothetical protein
MAGVTCGEPTRVLALDGTGWHWVAPPVDLPDSGPGPWNRKQDGVREKVRE